MNSDRMASRVPFGPINNIEQTFKHPQAVARGVVVEVQVMITACLLLHLLSPAFSTHELEISNWWARRSPTTGKRCPSTDPRHGFLSILMRYDNKYDRPVQMT